jgi:hypothetical protein
VSAAAPLADDHPLVTDAMRELAGVWDEWSDWSPTIRESDIRRWAIAVYWPAPPPGRFWDAAVAAATAEGGIVAPEELNPFAWPAPKRALPGPRPRAGALRQPDPSQVRRRINGGCRASYGAPMRPGDTIRRRVRLHSWRTTAGSRGPLLLVDYEHEWRNQRDEHVRTAVYTIIYS